ncbi:SDR family NAD(P)-dependent oxidoreductase [Agreia sp. Leaf283]|uniref:SDR family NAD(P)-dependent oxidoreductase n=1 Tax=Agreia sp. Leaf283 TaxID=1736321 RepID=UPI0006FC094F|nr:SDR family oxidoreductase [Agreia sp. Leaf283]KQP54726.1 short-chain dehydrogenase [Agreia sp. Leaf283]
MSSELVEKVAVVTGAGSGIGAESARRFARAGAAVVVADLNLEAAQSTVADIHQAGGTAAAVAFDLGDEQSIKELMASTAAQFGGIDVVFNNAAAVHLAGAKDTPIEHAGAELWDETMRINLRGTMLCTQFAAQYMLQRGGGSIVNTASDAGVSGDLGHPAYGASKAGIINLTKYAAVEYGKRGIRCNAIAPGLIVTPATEATWAAGPMRDIMLRQHLTPYLGSPKDIAEAALFLASERSRFISGQLLHVDGGLLAHHPYVADLVALSDQG